jgi:hypothetical protein
MSSNNLDSEPGRPTKVNPNGRPLGSRIPRGTVAVGAPVAIRKFLHMRREWDWEGTCKERNVIGRELNCCIHCIPAKAEISEIGPSVGEQMMSSDSSSMIR